MHLGRSLASQSGQGGSSVEESCTFNLGMTGARPIFKLVNSGDLHAAGVQMCKSIMVKVRKNGKFVLVLVRQRLANRRHEESLPLMSAPVPPTREVSR